MLAYPLTVDPARRVLADGPDTRLFMWTLAWDAHAFTHGPLSIFDANIYYPERHTLAYSENLIGSGLIATPILWLTDNPVLALNVVGLLSCMLCGLGAYVLARRLGMGSAAATLSGIVFAFSPPRFFRLSQLHLTTIQWVPFGLASLHAYFERGRKTDLRIALAFFTLQALTSGHGAVFLALAMLSLVVYRAVSGEPLAFGRWLKDMGVPGALLLAPALLVLIPYRSVQVEMGLSRSPDDWVSNWSSYLASPSHVHAWLLSLVPGARINETAQAYLFPGYLPLILAAAAFWRIRAPRARDAVQPQRTEWVPPSQTRMFYGLLTAGSLWLSAGPLAGLWPLVYWLPGLNFIRVPSRFSLLALLGLAMLAGMGFERVSASLVPRTRVVLATIVGALLVAGICRVAAWHRFVPAADSGRRPLARRAAQTVRPGRAAPRQIRGISARGNDATRNTCCTRWRTGKRLSKVTAGCDRPSTRSCTRNSSTFRTRRASAACCASAWTTSSCTRISTRRVSGPGSTRASAGSANGWHWSTRKAPDGCIAFEPQARRQAVDTIHARLAMT